MVVQTVQTSPMGVEVIASFRKIFGSKPLTVLVWQVGVAGLLERFSLVLGQWKNPSSNHSLVFLCGSIL
jgi:hypothetical protein